MLIENVKKTNFGPDFGPIGPKVFLLVFLPLVDIRRCRKLLLYAITREINEPNFRKWQKT